MLSTKNTVKISENKVLKRCHCEYNKVLRKAQTTHFKSSDTAVRPVHRAVTVVTQYCNNHLSNETTLCSTYSNGDQGVQVTTGDS